MGKAQTRLLECLRQKSLLAVEEQPRCIGTVQGVGESKGVLPNKALEFFFKLANAGHAK